MDTANSNQKDKSEDKSDKKELELKVYTKTELFKLKEEEQNELIKKIDSKVTVPELEKDRVDLLLKLTSKFDKDEKASPKENALDKKILEKDEEIKNLKAKLTEAREINKVKKGDIRAEVNRQGDIKLIKIGVDKFGRAVWKKANKLTDADLERRKEYILSIKQLNAKKY